jgi:hypothetical protein
MGPSENNVPTLPIGSPELRLRNHCCCWAKLRISPPGECAALAKLAEGEGFELVVRFTSA